MLLKTIEQICQISKHKNFRKYFEINVQIQSADASRVKVPGKLNCLLPVIYRCVSDLLLSAIQSRGRSLDFDRITRAGVSEIEYLGISLQTLTTVNIL